MTNFAHGQKAEEVAAAFLERKGCDIFARNWRTRRCEIDIVARKGDTVYLCEVKYRLNTGQGSGVEYITPKKLDQMRFAAESWVHVSGWKGDYQLCVIEVSGLGYTITNVIKDL